MRNTQFLIALIFVTSGCAAAPAHIANVEHAVVQNERQLERIKDSYDMSEQNIGRMRLSVFELVEHGRIVSQQLEMAAHDFQMAAIYNNLASDRFVRAADSYQRAANTYRQIASLIIRLASSGRFLDALCKQPARVEQFHSMLGAFGVKFDEKNVEQLFPRIWDRQNIELVARDKPALELPLPVMNVLVKRAARMLLCKQAESDID